MGFSPVNTIIIIVILVVAAVVIVTVTGILKRINIGVGNGNPSGSYTPQPPDPWEINNTQGYPLDPIDPKPPVCRLFTFTGGSDYTIVDPRLTQLPNCLVNGTCSEIPTTTDPYPSCYWPDQIFGFLGQHTCVKAFGPFAGTGCITQNGSSVPVGFVEQYYTTCSISNPKPACKDGSINLLIFNWNADAIVPQTDPSINPLKKFSCLNYSRDVDLLSLNTCDIRNSEQIWLITRYSYNGFTLIEDKAGNFFSIKDRITGKYLAPAGYTFLNRGEWINNNIPAPEGGEINLQMIPKIDEGVWWMFHQGDRNFMCTNFYPSVIPQFDCKAPPQIVFVPDYTQVPAASFEYDLRVYLQQAWSISVPITKEDLTENFVEMESIVPPFLFEYENNVVAPPDTETLEVVIKPFQVNRKVSNDVWSEVPFMLSTYQIEYSSYPQLIEAFSFFSQNQ